MTSADASSRRNSTLVASGILVSRVTGLARERAMAHFLGTGFAADAFTAAFRIPNLLQHLLGEGVLSASFVPVYSRLLAEGRETEAGRVAGAVAGLLAAIAGALALIGVLLARPLTVAIAAGFRSRPETFELTVTLVRILFPAVGVLVLSAWCLGVLNSHRRFFLSYVAPALLNLAQIAVLVGVGGLVLSGELAAELTATSAQARLATWLALGTVAGGLLQLGVQLPTVRRLSRELRVSVRTDLPGVRETVRAFVPVVSARGVVQLSAFAQVLLASFLAAGALASLRYAQILYLLPVSLFGMSVAAAELPELSREGSTDSARIARRLREGSARIAATVVPTTVGYLVVGDLITGALFRTGRFGRLDAIAVWIVLGGYALGLLASTSSRLLQSALYAVGEARTPARLAVLRVTVSLALGAVLMLQFDQFQVTASGVELAGSLPAYAPLPDALRDATGGGGAVRLGAAGLALAGGIAAWVEQLLLRRAVGRSLVSSQLGGGQLRPVLLAAGLAGLTAAALRPVLVALSPVLGGIAAVAVIAAVYVPLATWLGVDEVRAVLRSLTDRFRRA